VVKGASKLVKAVLREDRVEESINDEFTTEIVERYRVLSFDENGQYIQRIFEKSGTAAVFTVVGDLITPKINGEAFDEIPFFPCPGRSPEKSMLLGLALENIGHYQKTADYENGLHYTGVPTPMALNMKRPLDQNNKPMDVKLGGSSFLFFDGGEKAVDAKFLEFTGAGLGQLLQALNACLDRQAKLGIQAIGSEKKGVETAEVAKIHRASENGVLGAFARNMSDKITHAVRLMARWNNMPDTEVEAWSYELNTDFNYSEMSAQILSIMLTARMQNEIPKVVWFNALKENGKLPENMTFEYFVEAIEVDRGGSHGPDGVAA
jgi:hypothetical protein